ncbi:unnamed protein product [Phytomonas sp. EM1]|nr:unnamed protein product [Phytomonas sp. EM1]|eukprot:CCW64404.1 unnamed protein product [Phytomonas sp. isolate EM1]
MKRKRPSVEDSGRELPKAKTQIEKNPDLPLSVSELVEIHELVRKNNAETKPKRRLRTTDFLNEAFCTIALEAKNNPVKAGVVLKFFREFLALHGNLPRGETLARVLYAWLGCTALQASGEALIQAILASRSQLPEVFATTFDDRVATVVLRFLVQSTTQPDTAKLLEVVQLLPTGSLKRRVFSPLLSYARERADLGFALGVLAQANESAIELWDEDFHDLLMTISNCRKQGSIAGGEMRVAVEKVLETMEKYHPVTGSGNAELIKEILGGKEVSIVESGTGGICSGCEAALATFDLTEDERRGLLEDILEWLIKPRLGIATHYEPEKIVTAADQEARLAEFTRFQDQLAGISYDTVIDGANVGYHGLNSWYAESKESLLRRQGRDPNEVPLFQRRCPPQPVDVAPKFPLIEDLRQVLLNQGRKPLIVLHRRHLPELEVANAEVFRIWTEQHAILASPSFLNDDFCWLYAAVRRPNTWIVSNDQMRDHHFSILRPRFFLRWRQRHRITYTVFFHPHTRSTSLVVHTPRPYSVWVQSALAKTAKTTRRWHLPFIATIPILKQATNHPAATEGEVGLHKDGDDFCNAWLCTAAAEEGGGL